MNLIIQTERLILRKMMISDAEAMFKLDSNPNVVKYLGNTPFKSIGESINLINNVSNQYLKNGIGRFSVVLKETNEVIGWAGIKFVTEPENNQTHFYDLGYRLQEEHWGKGYATEATRAWLDYAFQTMNLPVLIASVNVDNFNSNKIVQKFGFQLKSQFYYGDIHCNWYELKNPNLS
ncbi:GNAT family N-acetyltransferase [Flavobacterium sp. GT3R68]|uniref:GNAT family N-acetyltransferase n=1 Tax=Flavobacterium sp. GT3R68 TaxID=2594437 RepID=UPI000F893A55|nr:GNAT family N-acetyltransferase [Flavobacterium sp. GT3R68]RTY93634.1 N-acetyltransferase [Flavobacterium sp. GSN2]TRW91645.1 GNAT family N-acetyltransferase [Flavobacterium sp. GT3R68]